MTAKAVHVIEEPEERAGDESSGAVLHQVLAASAQSFLAQDVDWRTDRRSPGAARGTGSAATISTIGAVPTHGPVSAGSNGAPDPAGEERVHQARVAMRRLRSNLRTFRVMVDPAWGTSLRAELAWYTGELGRLRDLHILRDRLAAAGPLLSGDDALDQITAIVTRATSAVGNQIVEVRTTDRYAHLVEQVMVVRDAPPFTSKAAKPAHTTLTPLLQRTWRDARGAAREARKHPTDVNLHTLRIRLKGLRYGSETVALIEGSPARATAKAAAQLQTKLGDLHDAVATIQWLHELADIHPELGWPAAVLVEDQQAVASTARKGWKKGFKDVEGRWHRWQG